MKALCLALLLAPTLSQAAGMPNTAKFLLQVGGGTMAPRSSAGEAQAIAVQDAERNIKKEMADANIDPEAQCRAVYYVWNTAIITPSSMGGGGWASIAVNIYCDPRNFQEKVAMSAQHACEQDPKPACMSPAYMNMFAKLQPTRYLNLRKPQE